MAGVASCEAGRAVRHGRHCGRRLRYPAARVLFQRAKRDREYRLFVLHDADPYGYNIARTLREETRRMKGYRVDVVDIGLRLEEALRMGLESEEFTRYQDIPQAVKDNLTDLEREWFVGRQVGKKSWLCRRVELNAMSAPQLVRYIEDKLAEHGATAKVLPPEDVVASHAEELYRALTEKLAERRILEMLDVLPWCRGRWSRRARPTSRACGTSWPGPSVQPAGIVARPCGGRGREGRAGGVGESRLVCCGVCADRIDGTLAGSGFDASFNGACTDTRRPAPCLGRLACILTVQEWWKWPEKA